MENGPYHGLPRYNTGVPLGSAIQNKIYICLGLQKTVVELDKLEGSAGFAPMIFYLLDRRFSLKARWYGHVELLYDPTGVLSECY